MTDEGSFRGNRQNVFEPAKDRVLGEGAWGHVLPVRVPFLRFPGPRDIVDGSIKRGLSHHGPNTFQWIRTVMGLRITAQTKTTAKPGAEGIV